jgi:hypothetical protein
MTLDEFNATLEKKTPPAVSPALVALWHDAKGDWERAHDEGNAAYWYRKAGKPVERGPLGDEWTRIVTALLSD